MRTLRRTPLIAAVGGLAAVTPIAVVAPAHAAPNPGQTIENDYGQTAAEVDAEVAAAVNADPAVKAARAKVAAAHTLAVARTAAETKAKKARTKAIKSHKKKAITRAKKAYRITHARAVAARTAETAARTAAAKVVAAATADVRWMHYRPVDGTYRGAQSIYYIPDDGAFHAIVVEIVVSGGHVTSVTVPVFEASGETGRINETALPVLVERAMAAHDTAEVAGVSGASLTSTAFRNSLSSALLRAGYHA